MPANTIFDHAIDGPAARRKKAAHLRRVALFVSRNTALTQVLIARASSLEAAADELEAIVCQRKAA